MSDTPIAERQQYWLDHIEAAKAFDGSIADYARSEGLEPKELYSWKGILARRGLLDDSAAASALERIDFVNFLNQPCAVGLAAVVVRRLVNADLVGHVITILD